MYSSRLLFKNVGLTPLYRATLDGKDACLDSLKKTPNKLEIAKRKVSPAMQDPTRKLCPK